MAGKSKGAAAVITSQYPLATCLHCASHCLNLAVVKSLYVQNMVIVVGKVYHFFNAHPKRQRALEEAISEIQSLSAKKKLNDMSRTRWIQCIDAVNVFQNHFPSIVECLGISSMKVQVNGVEIQSLMQGGFVWQSPQLILFVRLKILTNISFVFYSLSLSLSLSLLLNKIWIHRQSRGCYDFSIAHILLSVSLPCAHNA